MTALDHHERIDGSGYPSGKTRLSRTSQIVGLIDCYEALTNDDRPYRNALDGFQALDQIVKQDMRDGRFDADIYSQFVKSLTKH